VSADREFAETVEEVSKQALIDMLGERALSDETFRLMARLAVRIGSGLIARLNCDFRRLARKQIGRRARKVIEAASRLSEEEHAEIESVAQEVAARDRASEERLRAKREMMADVASMGAKARRQRATVKPRILSAYANLVRTARPRREIATVIADKCGCSPQYVRRVLLSVAPK
jgi:hypothetical protein